MTEKEQCSFCRKKQRDVRQLIAGPGVYICDECVAGCVDIIRDSNGPAQEAVDPSAAWRAPQWKGGGRAVYCGLCRLPFPMDEALLVEEKGVLCRPCVSQVQALSTEGGFVPDEKL